MKKNRPRMRLRRFASEVSAHTPFIKLVILMVILWLLFAAGIYLAERHEPGASISSYGQALYWGVAAFSTAGIADTPVSATALFIGGVWIVLGSVLFFGTIVATITSYFMRPIQRPHRQIIDSIEYNLEQLEDLSIEELNLLKQTVDTLIVHVERLKEKQTQV